MHSLAARHARQVAARLAHLATRVDGPLAAARAANANAVAARDINALEKVSQDFEDLGTILYAAEASAEAAVNLRRAGEARRAAAAEQKAARLLVRCEGATTPPARTIIGPCAPHSGRGAMPHCRRRRVARNKQIAGNMYLSVRTVESHLQRVYEKLGISGRHELADALRDQPTT